MEMRHLVSTADLSKEDVQAILEEAKKFISHPQWQIPTPLPLSGKHIVLAFFENSTRTRLSFEIAAHRLGASTVHFQAEGSSVQKGESLRNTIATITAMGYDAIVMRHAQDGVMREVVQQTTMHVINAGEGSNAHPTQGLLDASALLEQFGSLSGVKICLVGDIAHSRVARSQVDVCARLGATFALCAPEQFMPDVHDAMFGSMQRFENIDDALQWADVMSMLRIQRERITSTDVPSTDSYRTGYALTSERIASAKDVIVIHPGPVNVGVELDEDVVDHSRSLIHRQVTHGVAIRMSVLKHILQ